jgi:hypothetical protein
MTKRPTVWEYRYIKSLDELRDGEIFVSLDGTYHGHFAIGWAKRPVEDDTVSDNTVERV